MFDTDEAIKRVGRAKAFIDNGMCRVGPVFKPGDKVAAALSGGASRAIALSDAVVQLCRGEHPTEALPILRQLTETAVAMLWVAQGPGGRAQGPGGRAQGLGGRAQGLGGRAEAALAETVAGWEGLWPAGRLEERLRSAEVRDDSIAQVSALAGRFARGNSAASPWSHVFEENRQPGADAQLVLGLTVRMMGHVLNALDAWSKGAFPGGGSMWEPY